MADWIFRQNKCWAWIDWPLDDELCDKLPLFGEIILLLQGIKTENNYLFGDYRSVIRLNPFRAMQMIRSTRHCRGHEKLKTHYSKKKKKQNPKSYNPGALAWHTMTVSIHGTVFGNTWTRTELLSNPTRREVPINLLQCVMCVSYSNWIMIVHFLHARVCPCICVRIRACVCVFVSSAIGWFDVFSLSGVSS